MLGVLSAALMHPEFDVADVEYYLRGHEYVLGRREFDVRDVDFVLLEPVNDLAGVEIDVANIDSGN